jgi:hypothetical protein
VANFAPKNGDRLAAFRVIPQACVSRGSPPIGCEDVAVENGSELATGYSVEEVRFADDGSG